MDYLKDAKVFQFKAGGTKWSMYFMVVVCLDPHLGHDSGTHPFAAIFTCVGEHFL